MNEVSRIFKMTNAGIYLNDHETIPYRQTNLPNDHFRFTQSRDIYWKVKPTINEQEGSTTIIVEVLDYNCKDRDSFSKQKMKSELPSLQFRNLNWLEFIGQLASYAPNYINKSAFDPDSFDPLPNGTQSSLFFVGGKKPTEITQLPVLPQKVYDTALTWSFELPITKKWPEMKVKDGYIEVTHKTKEVNEVLLIKVQNDILRKEYDLIKNYFAKRLGKETVEIKATITIERQKIKQTDATSTDIDLIDESLLEVIRQEQIRYLSRKVGVNENKSLYTIEEALKEADQTVGNVLGQKIDDIIQVVTSNFTHRNAKQIKYLAKKHIASEEVVRLTLKPNFGFVFYFKCKNHHHYAWELLSSHATYVWGFPSDKFSRQNALAQLEEIINEIHLYGRELYRKKDKSNEVCEFIPINHKSGEDEKDTLFEKWRSVLDSL